MQKQIKKLKQAGKTIQSVLFQGSKLFRLQIEKETQEPYCNVVLLIIHAKQLNGKMITFQRTGTLVRKDGHWYVLTAARNVYNQAISNYYERLELYFIKKQEKNKSRFFCIKIQINDKTCLFDRRYISQKGPQIQNKIFEIAFIDIHDKINFIKDKPNGLQIWFGYKDKVQQIQKLNLLMSGYSFQNVDVQIKKQYQSYVLGAPFSKQKKFKDNMLIYKFSALKGHSGAPVFIKDQQKWKIIGIHIGAIQNQISSKTEIYNFAITLNEQSCVTKIITNENQNYWRNWIQQKQMEQYKIREKRESDTSVKFQGSELEKVQFQKQKKYPYSTIALLQIWKITQIQNKKIKKKPLIASGTLVNIDKYWYIMTAFHNLYDWENSRFHKQIKIFLIKNQTYYSKKHRFKQISIIPSDQNCLFNQNAKNKFKFQRNQIYQISFIDVHNEIQKISSQICCSKIIQIQYDFVSTYKNVSQQKYLISGYSWQYNRKQDQILKKCQYQVQIDNSKKENSQKIKIKMKKYMFFHQSSTTQGLSGSPVMIYDKLQKKYKIIGIHLGACHIEQKDKLILYNRAVCFNTKKTIENILHKTYQLNAKQEDSDVTLQSISLVELSKNHIKQQQQNCSQYTQSQQHQQTPQNQEQNNYLQADKAMKKKQENPCYHAKGNCINQNNQKKNNFFCTLI